MHRTLGTVFMVIGVIGILSSLMLIPAIWMGHNMLDQQISSLATQVRTPLQQAADSAGIVHDRLQTLRTNIDELPTSELVARIDESVGPRYQQVKDAYLQMRDRLVAGAQAAATLRQLVPWVPLPQLSLPLDDLTSIDQAFARFDTSLQQIRAGLSDGVQQLDDALDAITARVDDVATRAQQAMAQVDEMQATLEGSITAIATVLTVLCVYGAALHAALFAYGRSLSQRSSSVQQPLPDPAATARSPAPGTLPPLPES
jgi:hypothetical protein